VQAAVRTLIAAELVRRDGQGAATTYTYAADQAMAQGMLAVIRLSRQAQTAPDAPLPWLARLVRETPRERIQQPFGDRQERMPSEEGTASVLAANALIPEGTLPRSRPGLITRR